MIRTAALSCLIATGISAQVQFKDLLKSPAENWLTYHGDYRGTRYSSLTQVNRENAGNLVPVWTYHVDRARRLETTPVVYDGVMYISNSNQVDAVDARTGRQIWSYVDTRSKRQDVTAVLRFSAMQYSSWPQTDISSRSTASPAACSGIASTRT